MKKSKVMVHSGNDPQALLPHSTAANRSLNCQQVQKKYKAYLLGKLPGRESESIAEHIRDCSECFLMDQKENGLHLGAYSDKENMAQVKRSGGGT